MSLSTKEIHEGAVSSISGTDLVMVSAPNGGYHPIPFNSLMSAIRNGIQIGARNLLLNSGQTPASTRIDYATPLEIGKTYTMTVCASIASGETHVVFGLNGGNFYDTLGIENPAVCNKQIFSKTLTLTHTPTWFYLYSAKGKLTVHWATLTEGNMPSAGWFPAPEDLRGGVIVRYSTTYDCTQKGGAHEPANEGAARCAKGCANGFLAFGTMESLCEFIGRTAESNIDEGSEHRFFNHKRTRRLAGGGLLKDGLDETPHRHSTQKRVESTTSYSLPKRPYSKLQSIRDCCIVFRRRCTKSSVCSDEAFDGNCIAARKEVAL